MKTRYKDMQKYAAYRRRKKLNYRKTTGSGAGRSDWSDEDALLAVNHDIPDRETAEQTGHSVEAVQAKRRRLRKGLEKVEGYDPDADPANPYRKKPRKQTA